MRLAVRKVAGFCRLVSKQFTDKFDEPTFAKLSSRGFIVVQGPETRKFLQGLTTNNISQLYQQKSPKAALYTLFLTPKGKIVSDAIIIRPLVYEGGVKKQAEDELWIDVSRDTCTSLFEHLRKYTWKKQVQLNNLAYEEDAPQLTAGFNKAVPESFDQVEDLRDKAGTWMPVETEEAAKNEVTENGGYANMAFFDPRAVKLGIRMMCGPKGFIYRGKIKKSDEKQYDKVCRLHGLSSSKAMTNKLPFMFNSDIFNGFSFNKGCYLGQEIVARAYYTGIVRRRVFPFVVENGAVIPPGETLYGENKVELGKVVESGEGYGTILSNYLPLLQQKWPLKIETPVPGKVKMPFSQDLYKYIEDIKSKQAKLQQIDL